MPEDYSWYASADSPELSIRLTYFRMSAKSLHFKKIFNFIITYLTIFYIGLVRSCIEYKYFLLNFLFNKIVLQKF